MPEFVPTRHELLLVRHWERTALDIFFFWFLSVQVGSCENREAAFARGRVRRVAELLGDDVVREVVSEVWVDFGQAQEPRAWDIFLHGDAEQIQSFQDEVHGKIAEEDDARFYEQLMNHVRGAAHDIRPGTLGAQWAQKAKALIAEQPDLALPEHGRRRKRDRCPDLVHS